MSSDAKEHIRAIYKNQLVLDSFQWYFTLFHDVFNIFITVLESFYFLLLLDSLPLAFKKPFVFVFSLVSPCLSVFSFFFLLFLLLLLLLSFFPSIILVFNFPFVVQSRVWPRSLAV